MQIKTLGVLLGALAVGSGLASLVEQPKDNQPPVLLRPPGTSNDELFLSRCIRCELCSQACPPKAIKAAPQEYGSQIGTPYIDASRTACILCDDLPCIDVCPTGALSRETEEIEDKRDVNMGVAVIDRDLCIALEGNRCEVCYRICPLIDEAITLGLSVREGDAIHTIFEPIIDPEACVGCGLCEERCVVREPHVAIRIKPSSIEGQY